MCREVYGVEGGRRKRGVEGGRRELKGRKEKSV